MGWRDKLRPASFRGVAFYIESSQVTTGRRVSVHEYPDRDQPFPEDMGKVGNSFRIDGYLLGENYLDDKAALKDAVETEGPGELIHPYYGSMSVQVGSVSFDEDKKEGGICKVSFQFYEAGNNKFPAPIDNKVFSLFEKAKKALNNAKKEFDKKFTIIKTAGYVVDSARKSVNDVATLYQAAVAGVEGSIQDIANLAYSVRNLKAETNTLLQAPANLSQRLFDSLALLETAVGAPKGRFQAYAGFFQYGNSTTGATTVGPATPMRAIEAENTYQFNTLQQRASLIGAITQIPELEFSTTEEAVIMRDRLVDLLEIQILATDDDDVYESFQDLKAQLVLILPDPDENLPDIQEVYVPNTTSSLVLSYEKFGNINSEEDIVLRNNLRHPGFILGGTTVEVLDV